MTAREPILYLISLG